VFSDDGESSGASPFKEDPDFERRVAHLRGGSGEAMIRSVELLDRRNRPSRWWPPAPLLPSACTSSIWRP
jgi:hypothetical protein